MSHDKRIGNKCSFHMDFLKLNHDNVCFVIPEDKGSGDTRKTHIVNLFRKTSYEMKINFILYTVKS